MYPLQRCRKRMLRMLVHPGELALFGLLWILIAETPTHCSRIGVWKRALDATELRAVSLIQKTKGTVEAAHGTGAPKEERKTPSSLMTQNSQEKNGFNFASPTGPGKQPVFAQGDDATDNQDKNKNLAALRETETIATKIGLKSSYVQLASGIAEASIKLSNGGALKQEGEITSDLVPLKCVYGLELRNPTIISSTITNKISEEGLKKINNLETEAKLINEKDQSSSFKDTTKELPSISTGNS